MPSITSVIRTRFLAPVTVCALLLAWQAPALAQTSTPATPPAAEGELQRAIHDYILAHPEVLVESLQLAKRRAEERVAAVTKSAIVAFKKDLGDDPQAPVLGNPKGDVTLIEFFDYRCPYCRQIEPQLQRLIKEDPGLRLVQKEFPILGPASVYAARMALAANKQGKHKEFHEALMAGKPNIDEADILKTAEDVGLDIDRLKVDMASPEIDLEIARSVQIARTLRLEGTPAFIVGTELVPGVTDRETLRSMVNDNRRGIN
jgi:protein-disulfide isomerase